MHMVAISWNARASLGIALSAARFLCAGRSWQPGYAVVLPSSVGPRVRTRIESDEALLAHIGCIILATWCGVATARHMRHNVVEVLLACARASRGVLLHVRVGLLSRQGCIR